MIRCSTSLLALIFVFTLSNICIYTVHAAGKSYYLFKKQKGSPTYLTITCASERLCSTVCGFSDSESHLPTFQHSFAADVKRSSF